MRDIIIDAWPAQVTHLSLLYESAPAYVTEQPCFLNAAFAARTELAPRQLLHELKAVEVRALLASHSCVELSTFSAAPPSLRFTRSSLLGATDVEY